MILTRASAVKLAIAAIFAISEFWAGQALAEPPVTVKLLTTDVELAPDGRYTQTTHSEMRVGNDAAAMRAGQTSIPFNATMQDLQVIEAYTLKPDGRHLKVDPSAVYEQSAQGAAQTAMLTDQRAKVIVFPQVAVGDTLVYTIRSKTKQPYFPGQFWFGDVYLRTIPINELRETIIAPKSFRLYVESHGVEFSKHDQGSTVVYAWHYAAPNVVPAEVTEISPLERTPHFFASTFKDYTALGHAYAALAAPKEAVTPKLSALANQITQGIRDRHDQAQMLYDWVSKHIRYVAIELGRGSLVPHAAEDVLTNGYGDCKDHVVLLSALLKAKGIDSEGVLINATNSYTLSRVPTFSELNHIITYLPEFNLYVDSTAVVAPFGVLPFSEYGKPVIHATLAGASLRSTPVVPPGLASVTTKTVSRLEKSGQLVGATTTTATGPYSIMLRMVGLGIQALGPESAAAQQLTSLGYVGATGQFDAGSPMNLTPSYTISGTFISKAWSDQLAGNTSFLLPGGLRVLSLSGDGLMGPLYPGKLKDTEPTYCFSGHETDELSLKVPAGVRFANIPRDVNVKTPNLQFSAHWSLTDETLAVRRSFESKIDQPLCTGAIRQQSVAALKQIADSYENQISIVGPGQSKNSSSKAANSPAFLPNSGEMEAFNAGVEAGRRRDFKAAVRSFSTVLADSKLPADQAYVVHVNRGLAYSGDGQYLPASQDFSAAIRLKPKDPNSYANRGWAYQRLNQNAFALADYSTAIRLSPSDMRLRFARGTLSFQDGKFDQAIQDYTILLRGTPNSTQLLVQRGMAYEKAGDGDNAAGDFKRAIELGDTSPDLPNYLCEALSRSHKPSDAISQCNTAIAINQFSGTSLEARGYAYYRLAQYTNALRDFEAAAHVYPNNAEYLFARGVAKTKSGNEGGGKQDMAEAQRLAPGVAKGMAKLRIVP